MSTTPVTHPPALRPKNLLGILSFLGKYPGGTALAIGMLLANIAIEMSFPRISGRVITDASNALATGHPFSPWHLAELYLALAAVRAAIGFRLGRLRNRLIQRTLRDIRAAYFDAVQRLSFAYHDRTNTGELISRGISDIARLQDFLFACLFLSVDISVAMVATVILIMLIRPVVGLIVLCTLTATVGLLIYYARRLHPEWRKVHDLHGGLTTAIQENIAGVRVVKAFAREGDEISKYRAKRDEFVNQVLRTVNFWAGRVPMAQFIFGLSMPLVLWVGGREVIAGTIPIGALAAVVFYLLGITNRMQAIGQLVNVIQNASASGERIMEVLEEPQGIRGGEKRLTKSGGADVRFENVSFHYANGAPAALHEVSFEIKSGQVLAVVGATGAGKSTLVHMIPRFYDPSSGVVRIDGVDLRELELLSLRNSVGMIFQETVLFSTTVAENIAYGRPDATREQIVAAARAAHADEFILQLDSGYETVIGERGVSLSGGQKQRLAIARAFLLDPRILIMDDATSSLDSKIERQIQEDMRRVCLGRTALVIAHRLTTVQHADSVLVLGKGAVVERGTPAELMARGGLFKELFQQGSPENEAVAENAPVSRP